ncbi:MAG: hypothetical protein ACRDPT_03960 [Streptomycetales bacterium]
MHYRGEERRFLTEVAAGWADMDGAAERETVAYTASVETGVHINDGGRCAVCGSAFPCVRTVQAGRARTAR